MTETPPKKKRLPFRWLNLAELVGVAALAIAALGYWDAHRERVQTDQQRAQEQRDKAAEAKARQAEERAQAQAQALKLTFLMTGAADGSGDKVRLTSTHLEQVIQTQTLWFPTVIRADSVSTTGNPRIEARWLAGGLNKAAKSSTGRVPVAIETTFIEDGQTKTDRAVYLLGYSRQGRLLGGAKVTLEGLSLARRNVSGDLQAAANGLWIGRG
jgi:hypothetical protein